MKMLVLVLNDEYKVDEVLLSLYKIGVKGATVIDSVGMGGILGVRIPFFRNQDRSYIQIQKPDNKTIFTVIEDDILKQAVNTLREKLSLDRPGTGFMFVIPVFEACGTSVISDDLE